MGLRFLKKEGKGSPNLAPQNHLDSLLDQRAQGLPLEFLIQRGWGRAQGFCISNKFPGDADAPGLGTVSGGPLRQTSPDVCHGSIPHPKRWKKATNLRRGHAVMTATPSGPAFTLSEIYPKEIM